MLCLPIFLCILYDFFSIRFNGVLSLKCGIEWSIESLRFPEKVLLRVWSFEFGGSFSKFVFKFVLDFNKFEEFKNKSNLRTSSATVSILLKCRNESI